MNLCEMQQEYRGDLDLLRCELDHMADYIASTEAFINWIWEFNVSWQHNKESRDYTTREMVNQFLAWKEKQDGHLR